MPYTLGLVGGITVEDAAQVAPDVLWFQLYRCWRNEHAIGFDLVRRAHAVGVHVLVLTIDVPVRTTRTREVKGTAAAGFCSRKPVSDCGSMCAPKNPSAISASAPSGCMPAGIGCT